MHWTIASPFFDPIRIHEGLWLDDFIEGGGHSFTKIPAMRVPSPLSWHVRSTRETPLAQWRDHWWQGSEAWRTTRGGCITVFPQLAAVVGVRKRWSLRDRPLLAWCLNVGDLYRGPRGALARHALRAADAIVVHSRGEVEPIARWIGVAPARVHFAPLHCAPIPDPGREPGADDEGPFVLSLGSANRDYQTLFDAVESLGYKTVVVASARAVRGLRVPRCIELRTGLPAEECHRLARRARVCVVPLRPTVTASGQITVVDALQMGCPLVATRCVGTEDYVRDGYNGRLVAPGSSTAMAAAIEHLWIDEGARARMTGAARVFADTELTDRAVAVHLRGILDRLS